MDYSKMFQRFLNLIQCLSKSVFQSILSTSKSLKSFLYKNSLMSLCCINGNNICLTRFFLMEIFKVIANRSIKQASTDKVYTLKFPGIPILQNIIKMFQKQLSTKLTFKEIIKIDYKNNYHLFCSIKFYFKNKKVITCNRVFTIRFLLNGHQR